jgi:hypothetical protein
MAPLDVPYHDDVQNSKVMPVFEKIFGFSRMRPQSLSSSKRYGINEEHIMQFELKLSFYGLTSRRWGWDCLRHYELLGLGVVPFFVDLPLAPLYSMAGLPRNELLSVLQRPEVKHVGFVSPSTSPTEGPYFIFKGTNAQPGGANVEFIPRNPEVIFSAMDRSNYSALQQQLLGYARKYLTTRAIAASLLERIGHRNATKVLHICGHNRLEFLQMSLLHGLVDLGIDVTSFPIIQGHYQRPRKEVRTIDTMKNLRDRWLVAHGNGFAWGFRVPSPRTTVERLHERIAKREFDVVAFSFTSYANLESLPFFDDVVRSYPRSHLVFVNGDDFFNGDADPTPINLRAEKFGHVFVRELYDPPRKCADVPMSTESWKPLLSRELALVMSGPKMENAQAMDFCNTSTIKEAMQQAESFQPHAENQNNVRDVVLTDGRHWGIPYFSPFLRSLRRCGCTAEVVFLVPDKSISKFWESHSDEDLGPLMPLRVFLVEWTQHPGELQNQQWFMIWAARAFLKTEMAMMYRRILVVDPLQIIFQRDLFVHMGTRKGIFLVRESVKRDVDPRGLMGFCYGNESLGMGRYGINHRLFGGTTTWMGTFLDLIANKSQYLLSNSCGFDAVITRLVLGEAIPVFNIWTNEVGPVVKLHPDDCRDISRNTDGEIIPRCGKFPAAVVMDLAACQ